MRVFTLIGVAVLMAGCGTRGLTVRDAVPGGDAGGGSVVSSGGAGGAVSTTTSGGASGTGGAGGVGGAAGTTSSGGAGGAGGAVGGAVTTGGAGGKGGAAGARSTGGAAGAGASGGCTAIMCEVLGCYIDTPVSCIAGIPDAISGNKTVSCAELCASPCCTGSGCIPAANKCPSGQLCAYPEAMEGTTSFVPKCMPAEQTCNGPDHRPCPAGQYCELFGILCSPPPKVICPTRASPCDYANQGGAGVCRVNPPDSQCGPGVTPSCGCDGVTYPSECARIAANVPLDHTGACTRVDAGGSGDGGGRE